MAHSFADRVCERESSSVKTSVLTQIHCRLVFVSATSGAASKGSGLRASDSVDRGMVIFGDRVGDLLAFKSSVN